MSNEKPMGVAILICDKVITEQGTMNKTLVSTFNTIRSKIFPCAHPALAIFVSLTNATGEKEVNLVFSSGETQIMKSGGKAVFDNPNQMVEFIFNLVNLPFARPGVYSFEVFVDGEYVFESRFNVIQIP